MAGTAFGTARLVELALSADDASLFRSVGPTIIGAMLNIYGNILILLTLYQSVRLGGFRADKGSDAPGVNLSPFLSIA